MGNFLAYPSSFSGGVRVAAEDVTGSGQLDVVTAQGPGGGQLATFDGRDLHGLNTFYPYGSDFTAGFFVAGDARTFAHPVGPLSSLPTVTVTVSNPAILDTGAVWFTATRTGDTSNPLVVHFTMGGTALGGVDFHMGFTEFDFGTGGSTARVPLTAADDNKFENKEVAVLTLSPSQYYNIGSPGSAAVEIVEMPVPVPANDCGCSGSHDLISTNSNVAANPASGRPVNFRVALCRPRISSLGLLSPVSRREEPCRKDRSLAAAWPGKRANGATTDRICSLVSGVSNWQPTSQVPQASGVQCTT